MKASLLLAALFPLILLAQKPLQAGDTIPAAIFSLTNEGGGTVRLPDKSKKLILLDLWATNCMGCIAGFPKMEKLQEQFKEQVQVILVNPETADSTRRFFSGRRFTGKKPSLPMISGSALLAALIPFDYVPWHVWIDQQGVVKFITDGYNATAENISTFLRTGTGIMGQIYASAITDKEGVEQKAVDYAIAHRVQYYSWLSKSIPGHYWESPDPGTDYSIYYSKGSIAKLFQEAFSENRKRDLHARNSTILEVSNPGKYISPDDLKDTSAFRKNGYYNYFLMVPESRRQDKYSLAQQELCRLFNVSASIEKREIECYALVSKEGSRNYWWTRESVQKAKSKDSVTYFNMPAKELIRNLNERFQLAKMPQPVINATGYEGNLNITLSRFALFPLKIDLLRKELNNVGLDIVKLYTAADVLVIKEKENK